MFLFINILVIILVLPLLVYNILSLLNIIELAGSGSSTSLFQEKIVNTFLTRPLSNLLNLLGYHAFSEVDILHFYLQDGTRASVEIAESCSGIYSVAVFISAFIAFILNEYNRFDITVTCLLFMGVIMAYFANLIRMLIIVLVGHYYGIESMIFIHSNIGWIIFMTWVFLFWSLIFYILPDSKKII